MIELQARASGTSFRKPTPSELDRIVRHEESHQWLPGEVKDRVRRELLEFKRHLDQLTCSSAWIQHCWQTGEHFPPQADTTPMRACECERCQRTGRLWPAHYSAAMKPSNAKRQRFISYECYLEGLTDWDAAQLPSSPSGMALRAIREGRIKIRRQRTQARSRRVVS